MPVKGYACSIIGSREMNQDAYLVNEAKVLFAVADGVGGVLKGEVASRMAVEGFEKLAPESGSLRPVAQLLQQQVLKEAVEILGEALMGTTLTALRVRDNVVSLCHIGDSHCYLVQEGCLRLMNQDHESFDETAGGTVLTSYLGVPPDLIQIVIQEEFFPILPGQSLVLCTDGLYRQLSETRIGALIREHACAPEALVEILCQEASAAEYSDNVTVVYITAS